jgi:hypothetical protein
MENMEVGVVGYFYEDQRKLHRDSDKYAGS